MTAAPERIWIDATYIDSTSRISVLPCNLGTSDVSRSLESDTKYTREDVVEARVTAAHRSGYEAARADAAKVGWQPIETAPKDGTLIDLWGRNLLHYAKIGERVVNVKWGRCTDWLGNERDDWLHRRGEDYEPTHWMPLPEPPEATP